jgi:RHS repeat-associated protein
VTSGRKTDANKKAINQFDYAYDSIGNRKKSAVNGDEVNYESDKLNRFTSRKAAARSASGNVVPTVNAGTPASQDTVEASSLAAATKDASFQYDPDGNLVSDGQWQYTWDAENRLIAMECLPGVSPAERKRLEFTYDAQSRRIAKNGFTQSAALWAQTSSLVFVYDGWNLIAEFNTTSDLKSRISDLKSYVWGLDLSGSIQGEGGVGGLLAMTDASSPNSTVFVSYDGNGNVVGLIGSADGSLNSSIEYSHFGQIVRSKGLQTKSNPFLFSTKYVDEETGLLYYGHRYYSPNIGRWISRDPIEEIGGINMFGFVRNDLINYYDYNGLVETPAVIRETVATIDPSYAQANASSVITHNYTKEWCVCGERIKNASVKVTSTIRILSGYNWTDKMNPSTTFEQHELRHVNISQNEGLLFENKLIDLLSKCRSVRCMSSTLEYIGQLAAYHEQNAVYINQSYDVIFYPPGPIRNIVISEKAVAYRMLKNYKNRLNEAITAMTAACTGFYPM